MLSRLNERSAVHSLGETCSEAAVILCFGKRWRAVGGVKNDVVRICDLSSSGLG